jgi:chromosome segregation ATPase
MRDIPIQDMTIERLRAELQAEYNRQAVVDTLNKQLRAELDEAIHDIKLFQKQAIGSNKENSDLEAEVKRFSKSNFAAMAERDELWDELEKHKTALIKIRENKHYDDCDGYDCDCNWYFALEVIEPETFKKLKGGE